MRKSALILLLSCLLLVGCGTSTEVPAQITGIPLSEEELVLSPQEMKAKAQ